MTKTSLNLINSAKNAEKIPYQKYKNRKNFNRKGITADKRASASTNKLQRTEFSSKLSNKF